MKISLLLVPIVVQAAVIPAEFKDQINKRAVQYVTVVSTTDIPVAQYLQQATAGSVAAAPVKAVVATPVAAAPVTTAAPAAAVAASVAAPATSPVAAATTSSSSLGSKIYSWLDSFFGIGSSSSAPSAASQAAAPIATSPGIAVAASAPAAPAATTDAFGNLLNPNTLTYTFPGNIALSGAVAGTVAASAGGGGATVAGSAAATAAATGGFFGFTEAASAAATVGASQVYSAPTASASGSSSGGGVVNSQYAANIKYGSQAKGITYSPYNKDDLCKSASQVAYDLKQLSAYSLIRLYSTDCSGIENVLANLNSNQKLFLGIWNIDPASVTSGLQAIQQAVGSSSRGWSSVDTISIGNEQVNAGTATVAQIGTGVSAARQWLKANAPNYSGSIVSVDTLNAVVSNPGLCEFLDYIAVNCHPFFTGSVSPSQAGSWLQSQISSVSSACGGSKPVLITETGWPTQGNSIGSCVPSVSNQADALQSIMSLLGGQSFSFTMYNDYWKSPGPYNVEQHWGIYGDPPS